MYRNKLGINRDPGQLRVKIGSNIFMMLIAVTVFSEVGFHNGKDLDYVVDPNLPPQQRAFKLLGQSMQIFGALFFLSVNQFMGSMFGTINTFSQERPVFLREQANKMYGVSAYFMAKTMAELPVFFFSPLIGTIIIYFGMRL